MNGLKLAGVELNRKTLADLALSDPATFAALIHQAKNAQPKDTPAHDTQAGTAPEKA